MCYFSRGLPYDHMMHLSIVLLSRAGSTLEGPKIAFQISLLIPSSLCTLLSTTCSLAHMIAFTFATVDRHV